jgi:hypothetical protein
MADKRILELGDLVMWLDAQAELKNVVGMIIEKVKTFDNHTEVIIHWFKPLGVEGRRRASYSPWPCSMLTLVSSLKEKENV